MDTKTKNIWRITGFVLMFLAALIIIKDEVIYLSDNGFDDYSDYDYSEDVESDCNIQGIILRGELTTYLEESCEYEQASSEDIVYLIEEADKDNDIKAIILEIDSYGGYSVADEEVANALKRATKPTVVLVRGAAASAAYYAATGADIIFASQDSDIGSIGVTASYLDYAEMNENSGFTFNELNTGKFKDMMNDNKALTEAERQLILRDLNIMNDNFIKAVVENRNLEVEQVKEIADGSIMLGRMAMEKGLIDRIGGEYEVKEYLEELLDKEVNICW